MFNKKNIEVVNIYDEDLKNQIKKKNYGVINVYNEDSNLKNNQIKMEINENLKFWGQVFPVSSFGKADGQMKIHIQDGIAPFRLELKVNNNLYRTIENIPAAEFNYATYVPPDNINYADTNCVIDDLPPGGYKFSAWDSSDPPQEVRALTDWNIVSPPFATLNGTVNPLTPNGGSSTEVFFEYGLTTAYEHVAEFGHVNGTEPVHCSLQLNSTNLVPGTLYHYRIKATNVNGTSYGDDVTFVTPATLPIVVTLPATNIS